MRYEKAEMQFVSPKIRKIMAENYSVVEIPDKYDATIIRKQPKIAKGLFLHGVTGSGKTYTLHAIRKDVLRGWECSQVETWVEILTEIKDRMNENKSTRQVIDNITERKFVFLDDVGAEKQTDWVQEQLYLLIDRCYRFEIPIFISTNLTLEQFTEKYGDRIVSRLYEMCEVYEMEEVDKRLQ